MREKGGEKNGWGLRCPEGASLGLICLASARLELSPGLSIRRGSTTWRRGLKNLRMIKFLLNFVATFAQKPSEERASAGQYIIGKAFTKPCL